MLTENDGFVLSEAYLDILHKGLDMAFLCNPNNPTGMLIPHRLLKRILEKCRKLDILLVVDECFLDFVKEPEEYSLKRSLSGFNNLFILKAFTKRYAMAGVRLVYGHHGPGSRAPGTYRDGICRGGKTACFSGGTVAEG